MGFVAEKRAGRDWRRKRRQVAGAGNGTVVRARHAWGFPGWYKGLAGRDARDYAEGLGVEWSMLERNRG